MNAEKLRALDLFCGAGGATRGLQQAGFIVTGMDIADQPRYVGDRFVRDDVTRSRMFFEPWRIADNYDFVWASPPCQSFSAYRRRDPSKVGASTPNLIPIVRETLNRAGVPYVIENVPGAPLLDPVTLCGSMFSLNVRRHRLFEARGFTIEPLVCAHDLQRGSFPQATNRRNRRRTVEVGVYRIPLATQQLAMGIDWMRLDELSEAIPPAYSHHIAKSFLAQRTR